MKLDDQQMTIDQMNCKHQFKRKFYKNGYRGTSECLKCQLEVPTEETKEMSRDDNN